MRKAAAERGSWEQLVAGVEAACRILIQVARRVVKREAMEGRLESATPWIRRYEERLICLIRSISEIYYFSADLPSLLNSHMDTSSQHSQKHTYSGCFRGKFSRNPP
jgi:hypothetical protein